MKFGVWVVDLMLQYAVGILNAAGHDRGGVVWLELTLELGLVGFVWPFSVFYVAFFSRLRGCWRGFGGQGCPGEGMSAARGVAARRPRGLPPSQNARLMWGSKPLPRAHCGGKGRNSL